MNKQVKQLIKASIAIEVLTIVVITLLNIVLYFIDGSWYWGVYPIICGIVFGSIILSAITQPIFSWWMKEKD
jgi:xanthine/uracil permease